MKKKISRMLPVEVIRPILSYLHPYQLKRLCEDASLCFYVDTQVWSDSFFFHDWLDLTILGISHLAFLEKYFYDKCRHAPCDFCVERIPTKGYCVAYEMLWRDVMKHRKAIGRVSNKREKSLLGPMTQRKNAKSVMERRCALENLFRGLDHRDYICKWSYKQALDSLFNCLPPIVWSTTVLWHLMDKIPVQILHMCKMILESQEMRDEWWHVAGLTNPCGNSDVGSELNKIFAPQCKHCLSDAQMKVKVMCCHPQPDTCVEELADMRATNFKGFFVLVCSPKPFADFF